MLANVISNEIIYINYTRIFATMLLAKFSTANVSIVCIYGLLVLNLYFALFIQPNHENNFQKSFLESLILLNLFAIPYPTIMKYVSK